MFTYVSIKEEMVESIWNGKVLVNSKNEKGKKQETLFPVNRIKLPNAREYIQVLCYRKFYCFVELPLQQIQIQI